MKVHLLTRQTIEKYVASHSQSKTPFASWLEEIKRADWITPYDIRSSFNSADLLGKSSSRIVFNIGGNKYRMICCYKFGRNKILLYVKWIGTHAEYTKLCNSGKQYSIDYY